MSFHIALKNNAILLLLLLLWFRFFFHIEICRRLALKCMYCCVVTGLQGADVVLSCSLIEEGGGVGGMMGGAMFKRTPSTLVFRDLVDNAGLSPELVTPYNPPETPDEDDLIFELMCKWCTLNDGICTLACFNNLWRWFSPTVPSIEIPDADSLLHADCDSKNVVCEISRYVPRGAAPDSLPAHFIGSVQVEGTGLSLTLVLQTSPRETAESDSPPLMQSKLNLPLSQSGTLLTEGKCVHNNNH